MSNTWCIGQWSAVVNWKNSPTWTYILEMRTNKTWMNQNPCRISDLCGKRSAVNTKAHSVICNNNNFKKKLKSVSEENSSELGLEWRKETKQAGIWERNSPGRKSYKCELWRLSTGSWRFQRTASSPLASKIRGSREDVRVHSQSTATLQLLPLLVSVNLTGRASSSDSLPHQKLWKLGMLKLLIFDSSAE